MSALTKDKEFRDEAARFFVEKLSEGSSTDDLARFDELETSITDELDELVANEEFMGKVDDISDEIYDFFLNGVDESRTIEAKAVVEDVVDALVEVDSGFGDLRQSIDDWEGLELSPVDDGPDLKALKNAVNIVFLAAFVLSLTFGVLYLRWARSPKGALAFLGATVAALGVIDLVAAGAVRSAVVSSVNDDDRLASAAVPVAADALLSPFRTVGIVWLVVGFGAVTASIVLRRRGRATLGPANADH